MSREVQILPVLRELFNHERSDGCNSLRDVVEDLRATVGEWHAGQQETQVAKSRVERVTDSLEDRENDLP